MIEQEVSATVEVPEVTYVQKTAVRLTKETTRFEVLLASRVVRVDRKWTKWDIDGNEISAEIRTFEFDFAELMAKLKFGITGAQIYAYLRTEFDERDPL